MASTQGRGRTASLEHTISASVRLGQASVTGARQLGQCGGMTAAPRSLTATLPERMEKTLTAGSGCSTLYTFVAPLNSARLDSAVQGRRTDVA